MSAQVKSLSEIIEETAREWRPKLNALETKANELEEKVNSLAERDDDLAGNRATRLIDNFSASIDVLEKKLETAVSEIKSVRHQIADVISRIDRLPVVSLDEAKDIYESEKPSEFVCSQCNCGLPSGDEQTCPGCGAPLQGQDTELVPKAKVRELLAAKHKCAKCGVPVNIADSACWSCGSTKAVVAKA